jgi:uncharacterized protein YhaN
VTGVEVTLGKLEATLDEVKQDVREIKEHVTRINGRVTSLEMSEEVRRATSSQWSRLSWMIVGTALSILGGTAVVIIKHIGGF